VKLNAPRAINKKFLIWANFISMIGPLNSSGRMKHIVVIGAGKGHYHRRAAPQHGRLSSDAGRSFVRSPRSLYSRRAQACRDSRRQGQLKAGRSAEREVCRPQCGPFHLTTRIAEGARAARTHYLELTEDVASALRVRAPAVDASAAFVPQSGLAPGFVSIAAFDLTKHFEALDSVKLRVGTLPQYPSNALARLGFTVSARTVAKI
jgi:hypothetical protein